MFLLLPEGVTKSKSIHLIQYFTQKSEKQKLKNDPFQYTN